MTYQKYNASKSFHFYHDTAWNGATIWDTYSRFIFDAENLKKNNKNQVYRIPYLHQEPHNTVWPL